MSHQVAFEDLVDYLEERLDSVEARRLSEHLVAGCPQCEADLAWLRRVLGLMATDRLVAAPPALMQRVLSLYRPPRRARPSLAALWAWLQSASRLRTAAIALAALVILGGTWWGWGSTSVAQAATLAEARGPVEVRLAGETEWRAATSGMVLTAGSALRSGKGATALLVYADGSRTYVGEDAQVVIISLNGQRNGRASNVHLGQLAGRTQHELISRASSVRVEAAGAIAQASAGDYEVQVRDAEVEVDAGHGPVEIVTEGKATHLAAGERGWVKGGHVQVATRKPRSGQGANHARGEGNSQPAGATPRGKPRSEAGDDGHGHGNTPPPGSKEDRCPAKRNLKSEDSGDRQEGRPTQPPSSRSPRKPAPQKPSTSHKRQEGSPKGHKGRANR